jgi:hypothetical protein
MPPRHYSPSVGGADAGRVESLRVEIFAGTTTSDTSSHKLVGPYMDDAIATALGKQKAWLARQEAAGRVIRVVEVREHFNVLNTPDWKVIAQCILTVAFHGDPVE